MGTSQPIHMQYRMNIQQPGFDPQFQSCGTRIVDWSVNTAILVPMIRIEADLIKTTGSADN